MEEPQVLWVGQPLPADPKYKGRTGYVAVRYSRSVIKVNDAVELKNPGGIPHIGLILSMFERNKDHQQLMEVQWFYRPSDFPPDLAKRKGWQSNEVFLSNHTDVNPIQSIERKVIVHSEALPKPPKATIHYYCNKRYTVNTSPPHFDTLPESDLLDARKQLVGPQHAVRTASPLSSPIVALGPSPSKASSGSSLTSAAVAAAAIAPATPPSQTASSPSRTRSSHNSTTVGASISAVAKQDSTDGQIPLSPTGSSSSEQERPQKKRRSRNSQGSDYGIKAELVESPESDDVAEVRRTLRHSTTKSTSSSLLSSPISSHAPSKPVSSAPPDSPLSNINSNDVAGTVSPRAVAAKLRFKRSSPHDGEGEPFEGSSHDAVKRARTIDALSEPTPSAVPKPNTSDSVLGTASLLSRRSQVNVPRMDTAATKAAAFIANASKVIINSSQKLPTVLAPVEAAQQETGSLASKLPSFTRLKSPSTIETTRPSAASSTSITPSSGGSYYERLKQFQANQFLAAVLPSDGTVGTKVTPTISTKATSVNESEVSTRVTKPLQTADGPYDVSPSLGKLNALAQAKLISPAVEKSVTELLLGSSSADIESVIWVLSILELCAKDNDLADCAESLTLMFKPK